MPKFKIDVGASGYARVRYDVDYERLEKDIEKAYPKELEFYDIPDTPDNYKRFVKKFVENRIQQYTTTIEVIRDDMDYTFDINFKT